MRTKHTVPTLMLCTFVYFVGMLAIYIFRGGPVSARLAFALCTTVVPAVATYLVFRFTRLIGYRLNTALLSFIFFVALQLVLSFLR